MQTALIVFAKEVRDNLRDRRTLLSALLFGPVFGPVLFMLLMKIAIAENLAGEDALPVIVVGAEHAPNLVQHLVEQGAEPEAPAEDNSSPRERVKKDRKSIVLVIPEDVGARLREAQPVTVQIYHDSSESSANRRAGRLERMLNGWSAQLGAQRLRARGMAPEIVRPYFVESIDVSTPASRAARIFGMLPYLVLLGTILGAFYLAIDATAGERERGSLESLLSLPLSRAQLVFGKVAAAAVFAAISQTLTVIMFALAFRQLDLSGLGIDTSLTAAQVLSMIAVSLPFAVFAAGMLTLVASYAKNYKEAQTYLSVVMLVPIIPVLIGMAKNVETSLAGVLIPGFSQHLLIMEIVKGADVSALYMLGSAGTTLAAGALMIAAAVALYRSERILG